MINPKIKPYSEVTIKVPKFVLHSQSVKYRSMGKRVGSYTTKEYKDYKKLISSQLSHLKPIDTKEDLFVSIHLNCINRRVGDLDNVVKGIYDAMEDSGVILNDRYVTSHYHSKSFGHSENNAEIKIYKINEIDKSK